MVHAKTQVQALDWTQPTLPLRPGHGARMTHDYKRNGTTSVYAALELATGQVTGECHPWHTHKEFLAFFNHLVRTHPRRPLHVVLDNFSIHSTPEVHRWLERHPTVHFHFTLKGASWMNLVKSWFSILRRKQIRRGVYRRDLAAHRRLQRTGSPLHLGHGCRRQPRHGRHSSADFRNGALAEHRGGRVYVRP
jgi:transposase